MKRRHLLDHLASHDCTLRREGANHSIYRNQRTGKQTSVGRHTEIDNNAARKIRKQLGIPAP